MSDDEKPLRRSDIRDIRRALYNGWEIDEPTRLRLVEKMLAIIDDPTSPQRSVIMATKTVVDMHTRDQECAKKIIDKEQPDKHEHTVSSNITTYQLPNNGRD